MFLINIDLSKLEKFGANVEGLLHEAAKRGARELVPAVHAHILEEANKKLHSRRQAFVNAVSTKQEGEDTWLVVLDKSARWIDDGSEPHEMIDSLLSTKNGRGKGVRRAKDGSAYRVIPFNHGPGKGGTNSTPAEQTLQQTIRAALKQADNKITGEKGIPYGKLERDQNGKPLTGLLHSLDIEHKPVKTHHGPGQGKGPVGAVRQGPTGIPFLQGVRIYQRETKNPNGSSSVKRAVMTFRVVSSKHKGTGRWFHPGNKPVLIFDEAYRWGQQHWETVVLPKIADYVLENA